MTRPQLFALSALILAAWFGTPRAQQLPSPGNDRALPTPSDRALPAPSEKGVPSPSSTDRDTSMQMQRNDPERGKVKNGDRNARMDRSERRFVEEMARHSLGEVEVGRIAENRGASEEVKKYGQRIVQDHGKANEELKQLAQSRGIKWPAEPDRAHRRSAERLQKLEGADFDKRFVSEMVKNHQADLKKAQKMAKDARDPELRAFAAKAAPVIEEHLNMARQLADSSATARGERSSKPAVAVKPGMPDASTGASRDRAGNVIEKGR
jgi:putative membrane protein